MWKVVSGMVVTAISLMIVGQLAAQGERRPRRPGGAMGIERVDMMLRSLTLTDDQKAKVAEIKKEYGPKLKAAFEKTESLLTDEQKKARREALEGAMAEGKNRREAREAATEAMKLTADQKTKMDDARKANQALDKELRDKVMSILTPEQKEQVKKAREEMMKRFSERQQ